MSSQATFSTLPTITRDGQQPDAPPPPPPAEEQPLTRSFAAQVVHDTFAKWGARLGVAWVGVLAFCAVFAPLLANSHPYALKQGGRWSSPLLAHLTPPDVILFVAAAAVVALWGFGRRLLPGQRFALFAWIVAAAVPLAYRAVLARDLGVWKREVGPLLTYSAVGISLVVVLALLVLVPLRAHLGRRVWTWAGGAVLALAIVLALFPVRPAAAVVFDQYRRAAAEGRIERAVHAPIPFSPTDRLRDQPQTRLTPPSRDHLMGTEYNGADVLSRMIHASRIALAIGFIATGIAVVLGCVIGGVMGYFAGRVDILGMRLIEIFEAIPTLFLLISFVAFFGRNLYLIMAIIGATSWSGYARFIRAEFLKLRNQDFVQAAIACGLPLRSVLFRHMLPNGIAPVLVSASFGVASAILAESVLSFLGLGLVDEPSWGDLLSQATGQGGTFQWWLAVFPGLAIFLTVFSYNLIGEALRDAIDPRLREGP